MHRRVLAILAVVAFCISTSLEAQTPQTTNYIQLEIITNARSAFDVNQRWLELLGDIGVDNVRLTQAGDRTPGIKKIESRGANTYKITGFLTSDEKLVLPGGRFSIRDKARMRSFFQGIKDDGAEVALAEKMAFGLTADQLVDLHSDLAKPYDRTTLERTPSSILSDVKTKVSTSIMISAGARAKLRDPYTLVDELQGLSCGTALSAALRPIGLVAAPRRKPGQSPEILITDSREVDEHWPIGWPLEVRPSKSAPKLFEQIPINVRNYRLSQVLPAIQNQLAIPFLFDYNSMAERGVDLNSVRVTLQSEKLSYQLALQRMVAQARPRMQMELRTDEAGKVFLWFSAR